MPYVLGVDIGDSFTSAAVCRRDGAGWGAPEAVRLSARSPAAASLIALSPTGTLLTGDGVRADDPGDPGRILRGFSRRVGDGVPMLVDDRSFRAQDLLAALVRLVVDRLREQEGEVCEQVAVAHPAGWGSHRQGLLAGALGEVGLDDATLVPGPVAAAEPWPVHGLLAGYDLGGTTCTTFLLDRAARRPVELLAHEEHPVGGDDLDDVLLAHVRAAIGRAVPDPPADAGSGPAAVLLRRDCTEARERLSDATVAHVPLPWWAPDPAHDEALRVDGAPPHALPVTRAELETLIRPLLRATVDGLARLLDDAGHDPADLTGVLLAGGAARTPLVAGLIGSRLGTPVLRDDDPRTTVARGAALAAQRIASGRRAGSAPVWPHEITAALPYTEPPPFPATPPLPFNETPPFPSAPPLPFNETPPFNEALPFAEAVPFTETPFAWAPGTAWDAEPPEPAGRMLTARGGGPR